MSLYTRPRFLYAGDTGLLVEFGNHIHQNIHQYVTALDNKITQLHINGIYETIPSYCSLYISYDPLVIPPEILVQSLKKLLSEYDNSVLPQTVHTQQWSIPVVYGGEYGIDLERIASHNHLTPEDVIDRHSRVVYRVYMMGFSPGFTYLAPLDPTLITSRHQKPRHTIPPCSVAIGGQQTAITCIPTPSGWNLLGQTPWKLFDPYRKPPFLLAIGDYVRFHPITVKEYQQQTTSCNSS